MELLSRNIIVDPFKTYSITEKVEVAVYRHLFDDPYVEDDIDELLINPNAPDAEAKAPQVPVCLTYVTKGLVDKFEVEREVLITIQSSRSDFEPAHVITAVDKLFKKLIETLTEDPSAMQEGLCMEIPDGFMSDRFPAVMFGPFDKSAFTNLSSSFVSKHEEYLSCIPLTKAEHTMATYCTGTRVYSLICESQNRFPASTIFDSNRSSVIMDGVAAAAPNTLLGKSDQGTLGCAGVWEPANKKIQMNIPAEMALRLEEAFESIPLEEPMFIQLATDLAADGVLVWDSAHARSPKRICKYGIVPSEATKLSCSFIGFVPKQAADTVLNHEDGFLIMLKTDHWKLLRHCLGGGMTCGVRSDNPDGLEVKFQFEKPEEDDEDGDAPGHNNHQH